MPWLSEATKDVTSCDKLRGGANIHYIRRFPNWATLQVEDLELRCKSESKPGELKHLSTRRKRKQFSDSLSSGDRTGNSPNRYRFGDVGVVGPLTLLLISNGRFLESYIIEGDSPVHVSIDNISGILSRSGHVKS